MDRNQSAFNLVSDWCGRQGLAVNPRKTTAVAFTRKSALDRLRPPSLNGIEIPLADEAKYLDVIFDCRLTRNKHIERVAESQKGCAIMQKCVEKIGDLVPKWTCGYILRW